MNEDLVRVMVELSEIKKIIKPIKIKEELVLEEKIKMKCGKYSVGAYCLASVIKILDFAIDYIIKYFTYKFQEEENVDKK